MKKSYITADIEANSEDYDIAKPRATTFYRKCDSSDDSPGVIYKNPNKKNPTKENPTDNSKPKMGKETPVHEFESNQKLPEVHNESQTRGTYTFKPRLKLTNCNQFIDKAEREKLFVINSYKHCSGKSVLPSVMTFDEDPDHFSSKFAKEFLCSSTPRQNAKNILSTSLSPSIESIDADF